MAEYVSVNMLKFTYNEGQITSLNLGQLAIFYFDNTEILLALRPRQRQICPLPKTITRRGTLWII